MTIDELMNRSGYEPEELTEGEWLIVQKFDAKRMTHQERDFVCKSGWLDGLWLDNISWPKFRGEQESQRITLNNMWKEKNDNTKQ